MIFMEFMVIYGKKYQPLRLSTNSVKTSAVLLLETLYFYVDFDNFCFVEELQLSRQIYFCMK